MMNELNIFKRTLSVIGEDIRHEHYPHVCAKAKLYTALATGIGLDALLHKFTLRESDELFKQRVAITQHVTKGVISNLMSVFKKIHRANHQRILGYKDDAENSKMSALQNAIDRFNGKMNFDEYLKNRLLELNTTDPNAYVIVEFGAFDNNTERAQCYPFEVYCQNVLDEHYERGTLEYLVVKTSRKVAKLVYNDMTLYMKDCTIKLTEVHEKEKPYGCVVWDKELDIDFLSLECIEIKNKHYIIEKPIPHNIGYVPAFKAGYMRDLATGGQTYVSPYDCVVEYLLKTLKINSELDLTMSLMAFPLRIRYGSTCTVCNGEKRVYSDESNESHTCTSCKGTGMSKPSSVAEEIVIESPSDPNMLIDLTKLVSYVAPPIDIIKFQDEYVTKLTNAAKAIMFNADLFTKKEVANTATEQTIDLQNVYDTLYDYAVHYAQSWKFGIETIANVMDLQVGLVCQTLFSKDFKLQGKADLVNDLEAANRAEVSPLIRRNIERDIMMIIYAEDKTEYMKYEVREMFNPFSGMAKDEILFLLTSDLINRSKKIQYAMLGIIFDELESEYLNQGLDFYALDNLKMKTLVAEKVAFYEQATAPKTPNLL